MYTSQHIAQTRTTISVSGIFSCGTTVENLSIAYLFHTDFYYRLALALFLGQFCRIEGFNGSLLMGKHALSSSSISSYSVLVLLGFFAMSALTSACHIHALLIRPCDLASRSHGNGTIHRWISRTDRTVSVCIALLVRTR